MNHDKPIRFVKYLSEIGSEETRARCGIRIKNPPIITAATCRPFLLRNMNKNPSPTSRFFRRKQVLSYKLRNPEHSSRQVRRALNARDTSYWNLNPIVRKTKHPTNPPARPDVVKIRARPLTAPAETTKPKQKKFADSSRKGTYQSQYVHRCLSDPDDDDVNRLRVVKINPATVTTDMRDCAAPEMRHLRRMLVENRRNKSDHQTILGPAAEHVVWQPTCAMAYELVGTKGVHVKRWEDDSKAKIMNKQTRNLEFKNHHWKSSVFSSEPTRAAGKECVYKYNNILGESVSGGDVARRNGGWRWYADVRNPITGARATYLR